MTRLLIIDDSASSRAKVREAVAPARVFDEAIEAEDGIQGLKMLLSEEIDVVVCDLEMPGFDGEKLLRVKEQRALASNIPFIFVTATGDLDRRARLIERGASDLISKPFHPPDLLARLQLHLKIKRLQDELMVKNESLAKLSTSDSLTGLRSRRYVSDMLNIEFLRACRYGSHLSIMMGDLDHFKSINDSYGHLAGDTALRGVSELLLSQLRATDVGGRYGGEEILVILYQVDVDGCAVVAERWRQAVEQAVFTSPDGREFQVQISIGCAAYHTEMDAPADLIAAADRALYRAKDRGRNCVET